MGEENWGRLRRTGRNKTIPEYELRLVPFDQPVSYDNFRKNGIPDIVIDSS